MREIFDGRLFLRKSNGLIPTPFADDLGLKAENLLANFDALLAPEKFDPAIASATYVIAATDYAQQSDQDSLHNWVIELLRDEYDA